MSGQFWVNSCAGARKVPTPSVIISPPFFHHLPPIAPCYTRHLKKKPSSKKFTQTILFFFLALLAHLYICICRYVYIHREPNTFGWRSCEFYETRPPWLPPRSPGTPGSPGGGSPQNWPRPNNNRSALEYSIGSLYYIVLSSIVWIMYYLYIYIFPDVGVGWVGLFGVVGPWNAFATSQRNGPCISPTVREGR